MRGGAIPLLVWGSMLALVMGINWVWTGDMIQVATFAFAALSVIAFGLAFVVLRPREALRRGAPPAPAEPQSVASASYGSVLLAVGAAALVFGFAFGHFFIFFGAGLMIIAIGVIVREQHAERQARRRWRGGSES